MITMSAEEAVARAFPHSTGYDRAQAKRLLSWLEKCGYVVVPKETLKQPKPRTLKAA